MISHKYSLTSADLQKWVRNQIEFLKPMAAYVGVLYLMPIVTLLSDTSHVVTLADFEPSSTTIRVILLYVINAIYDLLRKWAGKNRYWQLTGKICYYVPARIILGQQQSCKQPSRKERHYVKLGSKNPNPSRQAGVYYKGKRFFGGLASQLAKAFVACQPTKEAFFYAKSKNNPHLHKRQTSKLW